MNIVFYLRLKPSSPSCSSNDSSWTEKKKTIELQLVVPRDAEIGCREKTKWDRVSRWSDRVYSSLPDLNGCTTSTEVARLSVNLEIQVWRNALMSQYGNDKWQTLLWGPTSRLHSLNWRLIRIWWEWCVSKRSHLLEANSSYISSFAIHGNDWRDTWIFLSKGQVCGLSCIEQSQIGVFPLVCLFSNEVYSGVMSG